MHPADRIFWKLCSQKYNKYFNGPVDVLDVGSMDMNGSIHEYFGKVQSYTGVDWREGPGVDVVVSAKDMRFDKQFDVIVSASMLEHDTEWQDSIKTMIYYLKDSGIMILSWGGALNVAHEPQTAKDHGFHALPAGQLIKFLTDNGLYIHEFRYQGQLPGFKLSDGTGSCPGNPYITTYEVPTLVIFKKKEYAIGDPIMMELIPEDRI